MHFPHSSRPRVESSRVDSFLAASAISAASAAARFTVGPFLLDTGHLALSLSLSLSSLAVEYHAGCCRGTALRSRSSRGSSVSEKLVHSALATVGSEE